MVRRAQAMGEAFADRRTVLHDVVEGDGFVGFAFDIHARHVGRWVGLSALVEPTGRDVVLHGMDVIHLDADGRATEIWAVNDQSDLLIPSGLTRFGPRLFRPMRRGSVLAEVRLPHVVAREQLLAGAVEDDAADLEDVALVGELERRLRVLLD